MQNYINDVPVRVEKIAMLENPTSLGQTNFLFTLSKKGIAAHMTDTGDIYVTTSFLNDLAMEDFIDQEMETFIMENKVEKILFVDTMVTR